MPVAVMSRRFGPTFCWYRLDMATLSARERAALPNRGFAYIDSRGMRRLPIHDAAHVRNALARFNQVDFEDEAVRDQARSRLLRAARRFRIVPVGFITSQLGGGKPPGRSGQRSGRVRHAAHDRCRRLDEPGQPTRRPLRHTDR